MSITKPAFITATDMKSIFFLLLSITPIAALGWDGYDYENGSFVEIDKGQLVRSGRDIEVFDYSKGRYIDVEVQSIRRVGRKVEIEVTDLETGEDRTLEMD